MQVLDYDLQRQVAPHMANQEKLADNLIPGSDKRARLEQICADVCTFNELDRIIVFWTANTERYGNIIPSVNDTADNLLNTIKTSHAEVSLSTLFALAAILEGEPFVNGAPRNTFVPFIGGDDLKSGQTKLKSILAEFLVNTSIKPILIVCYNHLSNNDGGG